MDNVARPTQEYLDTLLLYYEEEIIGEACFYALVDFYGEPYKTTLIARAETVAAEAVEPLLQKYQLKPRDRDELERIGLESVDWYQGFNWAGFMQYIVERFPGYIEDFRDLEAMGPPEDQPYLQKLTQHEFAVIDFAEREIAGDPGSTAPMLKYLA